ncbi:hypothetical protein SAMN06297129_3293 [Pseudooceanicola antarcticus]|uniref:DUF2946 family protein n=1 Tax=Pseudooceanicola antarcticus TaxID=1247613 RepID=A0A285J885_9RHOB|nr:hypothetical protein [Pseudooceanicola antarcticus]SNY56458.1 hypothetical protein SAMN06297129_3293 [Pseudooceanicola antarcticus]
MRRSAGQWGAITIWVLCAPFFLLSFVSGGVMPVKTTEGIRLVICTGDEIREVLVDPQTGQPLEDQDSPADAAGKCSWSFAHMAANLAPDLRLPRPEARALPLSPAVTPVILIAARATGLPPATGPPARI